MSTRTALTAALALGLAGTTFSAQANTLPLMQYGGTMVYGMASTPDSMQTQGWGQNLHGYGIRQRITGDIHLGLWSLRHTHEGHNALGNYQRELEIAQLSSPALELSFQRLNPRHDGIDQRRVVLIDNRLRLQSAQLRPARGEALHGALRLTGAGSNGQWWAHYEQARFEGMERSRQGMRLEYRHQQGGLSLALYAGARQDEFAATHGEAGLRLQWRPALGSRRGGSHANALLGDAGPIIHTTGLLARPAEQSETVIHRTKLYAKPLNRSDARNVAKRARQLAEDEVQRDRSTIDADAEQEFENTVRQRVETEVRGDTPPTNAEALPKVKERADVELARIAAQTGTDGSPRRPYVALDLSGVNDGDALKTAVMNADQVVEDFNSRYAPGSDDRRAVIQISASQFNDLAVETQELLRNFWAARVLRLAFAQAVERVYLDKINAAYPTALEEAERMGELDRARAAYLAEYQANVYDRHFGQLTRAMTRHKALSGVYFIGGAEPAENQYSVFTSDSGTGSGLTLTEFGRACAGRAGFSQRVCKLLPGAPVENDELRRFLATSPFGGYDGTGNVPAHYVEEFNREGSGSNVVDSSAMNPAVTNNAADNSNQRVLKENAVFVVTSDNAVLPGFTLGEGSQMVSEGGFLPVWDENNNPYFWVAAVNSYGHSGLSYQLYPGPQDEVSSPLLNNEDRSGGRMASTTAKLTVTGSIRLMDGAGLHHLEIHARDLQRSELGYKSSLIRISRNSVATLNNVRVVGRKNNPSLRRAVWVGNRGTLILNLPREGRFFDSAKSAAWVDGKSRQAGGVQLYDYASNELQYLPFTNTKTGRRILPGASREVVSQEEYRQEEYQSVRRGCGLCKNKKSRSEAPAQ